MLLDANFRPIRRSALPTGVEPRVVPEQRTYRMITRQASSLEVQANARVWGVEASGGLSMSYGYVRAVQLERIYGLPRDVDLSQVPAEAAYVISRVYYGRMYEMRVSGSRAAVAARVDFISGAGGLTAEASASRVEGMTIGLVPRGDAMEALAASSPEEIIQRFEIRGDPAPIMIEFEPVTRRRPADELTFGTAPTTSDAPPVARARRYRLAVIAIAFPDRKPGNGWPWDTGLDGRPDMAVVFSQAGRRIVEIPAPPNQTEHRFPAEQPLPEPLELSADRPLVIDFIDRDVMANDSCGRATLTEASSGDIWLTSQYGARVLLRVQLE